MKDKSAKSMNLATKDAFRKIPAGKLKTMTFDNGKEFAGFKELEKHIAQARLAVPGLFIPDNARNGRIVRQVLLL